MAINTDVNTGLQSITNGIVIRYISRSSGIIIKKDGIVKSCSNIRPETLSARKWYAE